MTELIGTLFPRSLKPFKRREIAGIFNKLSSFVGLDELLPGNLSASAKDKMISFLACISNWENYIFFELACLQMSPISFVACANNHYDLFRLEDRPLNLG